MNNDLNKTIHSGRFTLDPELKMAQTPKGDIPMVKFTLAVNKYSKKEKQSIPMYMDFVAYRRQAEFVARWFRKGDEVYIFGKLVSRRFPSKSGTNETVKVTEIVADEIYFGNRSKANKRADENYGTADLLPPLPNDDDIPEYVPDDDLPF